MRSMRRWPARDTRRARRALYPLVLLLMALSLAPASLHSAAARAGAAATMPRFEQTSCRFKLGAGLVAGKDVRCGFVVVPENRAAPANGRVVRLAVAIFKNPSPARRPDPFIFLQGGPGGALLSQFAPQVTSKNIRDYVTDRDLIMLDQRGTGYSTPALNCPELDAVTIKTLDKPLSAQQQADLQVTAARQCHDRLAAAGIDLNAFTSIDNAADVADVRRALGYQSVNIYGVSYGTRLALTLMRTHPEGIRSVILDSVVAPQANQIADPLTTTKRVFDVLFQGCRQDAGCNGAFPHLDATFYRVVARLNAHPATIQTTDPAGKKYTALLNGDAFVSLLFQMLYVTPFIPALPVMIAQADQGNFRIPALVYGSFVLDFSTNLGVYLSVECGEDGPYTSVAQITAAAQPLNPVIRPGWLVSQLGNYWQCQVWKERGVPAVQKQAVASSIPTLVLSGEYDPVTPPDQSLRVAKTLRHGYRFVFPGMGHGEYLYPLTQQRCPYAIASAFLDDPTRAPSGACVALMSGPRFLIPRTG